MGTERPVSHHISTMALTSCKEIWDPGKTTISKTLSHFLSYMSGINDVLLCGTEEEREDCSCTSDNESRTELDSHANMLVVGSECFIIAETKRKATVRPY